MIIDNNAADLEKINKEASEFFGKELAKACEKEIRKKINEKLEECKEIEGYGCYAQLDERWRIHLDGYFTMAGLMETIKILGIK